MERTALAWEIEASWRGWSLDDEYGPYAGYLPWLPMIPVSAWFLQFRQDAGRRALIRAQVEVVLEAQRLIGAKG